jgi:hypothetical protein
VIARLLGRRRRKRFHAVLADADDLATNVAEVFSEEVVRLRGAMQVALDSLSDSRASHDFKEARARKALRDALRYDGWLANVIERRGGDAA